MLATLVKSLQARPVREPVRDPPARSGRLVLSSVFAGSSQVPLPRQILAGRHTGINRGRRAQTPGSLRDEEARTASIYKSKTKTVCRSHVAISSVSIQN